MPPTPVEAEAVTVATVTQRIEAVATLLADESVTIRPETSGRITELNISEGQRVEEGALLIRLDDSVLRAEIAEIEASLKLSRQNLSRTQDLYERSAIAEQKLDEAKAIVAGDEARLARSKALQAKTRITAPFSGLLGFREVSVGDYVDAGQTVVAIERIDPIKVEFRVPERYFGTLRVGQTVELTTDAYPDISFLGEVYAIAPRLDPATRSVAVRAHLSNPEDVLRPGMFAHVSLITASRADAVLVPEQAIVPVGEDRFVYRVLDGKAVFTKVATGVRQDAKVEIVDGLAPGDFVVTAGQLKIRDGAPVANLNAADAS